MVKKDIINTFDINQKKASPFTKLRYSRKARLIIIGVLLLIVVILLFYWKKARIGLIIALIALLAAFGLEVSKNDWDLGKLLNTRSFKESKVSRDEKGNILFDKFGNITTDQIKGKSANNYNCSDFTTQPEAQTFFIKVGGVNNDINRLDGNKDGIACQSLPKGY